VVYVPWAVLDITTRYCQRFFYLGFEGYFADNY
jgi:hypothetical protein